MRNKKARMIDCRSPEGKAVSLVDTINQLCVLLGKMGGKRLESKAVKDAIRDLQADELAYFALRRLYITKYIEAHETLIHEVVSKMSASDKKRIFEIINSID